MNLKGHDKSWREGIEGEIMEFYFNFKNKKNGSTYLYYTACYFDMYSFDDCFSQ